MIARVIHICGEVKQIPKEDNTMERNRMNLMICKAMLVLGMMLSVLVSQCVAPDIALGAVVKDDIRFMIMYDTGMNYTQAEFNALKSIGVTAVEDGMVWGVFENPQGTWNWNTAGSSIDQNHNYAVNAGLTWIPQISLQYRPDWLTNNRNPNPPQPTDYVQDSGQVSSYWYANPPNLLNPNSKGYMDSAIDAVYGHISASGWAYPETIFIAVGSLGEGYYPAESTGYYAAFDTYTVAAWRSYTSNPNAWPYRYDGDPNGVGGTWQTFMD